MPEGSQVKDGAAKVGEGAEKVGLSKENPLGLAIGGAAVGFLAGMLLPSTRVEDENLGEVSDQVIDRVKETGQDALERGKQVAQETLATPRKQPSRAAQNTPERGRRTQRNCPRRRPNRKQHPKRATKPARLGEHLPGAAQPFMPSKGLETCRPRDRKSSSRPADHNADTTTRPSTRSTSMPELTQSARTTTSLAPHTRPRAGRSPA